MISIVETRFCIDRRDLFLVAHSCDRPFFAVGAFSAGCRRQAFEQLKRKRQLCDYLLHSNSLLFKAFAASGLSVQGVHFIQ
jgi:hypothetical protein